MIGLDTNVLVRYIMQDDPVQSERAVRLVESLSPQQPGFVALVSVVEIVWVLKSCYGFERVQLAQVLDALLKTRELVIEQAGQVLAALRSFEGGRADFADCLIASAAAQAGCEQVVTFDLRASKAAGMTLLS